MSQKLEEAIKRRKAIWEAMGKTLYPETRPLLTLEQFFLHSEGEADLWYNIYPTPEGIDQYAHYCSIRARTDVWDVLVSITQLDSVPAMNLTEQEQAPFFEWPNSDHTLIITTANEKTIRSWFPDNIQPDEIDFGSREGSEWGGPGFVPEDFELAWLWYD